MKRILLFFGIFSFMLLFTFNNTIDAKGKIRTVVIDPGHGGRDPGALGRNSMEKDIVLAIGLKLGQYIEENLPDVRVIYTRKTDEFVKLYRRAQIANENNADLFISLHCNSSRVKSTYGTETYVMGLHRSQANLEVAKRENAAILYEDDYEETYDGFDPYSPEANIIFTLYQNAYLENSLDMASFVQQQFLERANRIDRGVKQAGFLVLYQITMPGVLIETGFLSNPEEERFLMSETGRAYIASAIFRAFREYKEEQERLYAARKNNHIKPAEIQQHQEVKKEIYEKEKIPGSVDDHKIVANVTKEINTHNINDEDVECSKREISEIINDDNKANISFRVQIATASVKKPLDSPEFSILKEVDYYFHEGLYKYTVGNANTLEAAAKIQEEVQKAGFKDAFVVAFFNEERISPSEAIRLLRQMNNENN